MRKSTSFIVSRAAVLLMALLLEGCAGQRIHREGMALMEEGRVEEGLEKLAESSKLEPGNLSYRVALVRYREQTANKLLAKATNERATEQFDQARATYERALKVDPGNSGAMTGLELLVMDRRHAAMRNDAGAAYKRKELDAAAAILKNVLLENPANVQANILQRQIDDEAAKGLSASPTLKGKFKKPVSLQFRDANLKMVFEALSRTSGINALLDKDVKPDAKISIFVKDVSVEDAIDLILLQSQLEKKVISDNTVFIYPNTPAKLKDYQDLKIRSFHLANADPKQILTMIKTLLKTKDIFIHEKTNSIVMRDTPDAILLAERLVADQDIADPEVMLEVEVLEISGNRLSEIGVKYPNQMNFFFQGQVSGTNGATTLESLKHINSGNILVTPTPVVTLNLLLQDGQSNLLASPRIRARNREKARIMIGDRVPVITNAVTPVSTGTPVVTGSVQYLDVGLKLEVESDIHPDNEVGIKISLEVSSIVKEVQNTVSGTLAYQIGTRNASTALRLKDGETQILAGLISDEDRNSASKVPGLGQLPVLGRLFSSHRDDVKKTEIVLSITPRVISNVRPTDFRNADYWAGTEASLRSNPLMLRSLGTVAVNGSAVPATAVAASRPAAARTGTPGIVSPATQPLILSWEGPNQAKVGDKISVTINTQSSQRVNNIGMQIGFDPSVLKAVDVIEGNFLKQSNLASTFTKNIDPAGGQMTIELAGSETVGASGAGSVATLIFEAIAAGVQSKITATPVNSGGEAITMTMPGPHQVEVSQ
jgi:general secretion pathway protein D